MLFFKETEDLWCWCCAVFPVEILSPPIAWTLDVGFLELLTDLVEMVIFPPLAA